MALVVIFYFCLLASFSFSLPIARYMKITATANQEIVITLLPYNTDTSITSFTVTITSLPSLGALYQTSYNYENYGYMPTRGTIISAENTVVTSSVYRIVYLAPSNFGYTYFKYNTTDSSGLKNEGIVSLTLADSVAISSYFWVDHESWTVVNAITSAASWSATSTGLLNYFIFGGDFDPSVGMLNDVRWYFNAPSKFLGNVLYTYNGVLSFNLGAFAGDFITYAMTPPYNFVQLIGVNGIVLTQRFVNVTIDTKTFSFVLNESPSNGWLKDPKNNVIQNWSSPTNCEFVSVLSALAGIRIYADVTTSYEVMGLDAVTMTSGATNSLPYSCYQ